MENQEIGKVYEEMIIISLQEIIGFMKSMRPAGYLGATYEEQKEQCNTQTLFQENLYDLERWLKQRFEYLENTKEWTEEMKAGFRNLIIPEDSRFFIQEKKEAGEISSTGMSFFLLKKRELKILLKEYSALKKAHENLLIAMSSMTTQIKELTGDDEKKEE
ncbi:hypothetical protein RIU14_05000 [Riemerella anatipestifer]|uniref:hypothetical protein n=1 Tax=Riemerella anatipestifer TaxID=34085 RepID=UPI00069A7C72|nr:hypothetical protein [Riemerella anatipestifer]MDR7694126.1 hypothetical protein [Riemerella anatipestifer]